MIPKKNIVLNTDPNIVCQIQAEFWQFLLSFLCCLSSVYHNIINDETPVLQVNGHMDPVILISTAGQTAEALRECLEKKTFRA